MRITPATDRDPLAGKALRFRRSAAELCKFKRLKRAQRDVVSLQRGAGSLPMAFSEGGLGPPILCKLLWLIWWATSLGQACTRMPSMPIFSREVAKTLRNVFGISSGYKHDSPTSESVVSKVAAPHTLAANAARSRTMARRAHGVSRAGWSPFRLVFWAFHRSHDHGHHDHGLVHFYMTDFQSVTEIRRAEELRRTGSLSYGPGGPILHHGCSARKWRCPTKLTCRRRDLRQDFRISLNRRAFP
jgi:hypothetical protein